MFGQVCHSKITTKFQLLSVVLFALFEIVFASDLLHESHEFRRNATTPYSTNPFKVYPVGYGIVVFIFTWMIIYYDSYVPGIVPPTPLSPGKYRKQSGHTFHLPYVLAVVNGISAMIISMIYL